uniref:Uncharacterized protein n=1 Tax=viral metagenome TaxID=1070528 RepID=A0A6C0AFH5_9ZZZZ
MRFLLALIILINSRKILEKIKFTKILIRRFKNIPFPQNKLMQNNYT